MFLVFIKRKCSGYFMLKFLIWLYINIVVNSELIMILNNKENVLKTNNRIVWGNAVVKSYIGYSNYVKPQWKFQLKTLFCVSCSQKHICKIFCSFSHAGIAIMYSCKSILTMSWNEPWDAPTLPPKWGWRINISDKNLLGRKGQKILISEREMYFRGLLYWGEVQGIFAKVKNCIIAV